MSEVVPADKAARSATDSVYNTLRRQIMAGTFAPGVQLKEEQIAEAMSVSRTPVRTALQRLVGDGLLRSATNRGVFVAEWTRWDIEDVFELRLALEPLAAGLAAERASEDQIAAMTALTDTMDRLSGAAFRDHLQDIQDANHAFHNLVIEAAGSPRLMNFALTLTGMPMIVGTFHFYDQADMRGSVQHHREIIAAIKGRDRNFASQVMAVHLRVTHEIFKRNRTDDSPK
jgi:DNA-binding GntR family transcriptional regulator